MSDADPGAIRTQSASAWRMTVHEKLQMRSEEAEQPDGDRPDARITARHSRLESLKNITERYDGYGNSIRRVMEQKEPGAWALWALWQI